MRPPGALAIGSAEGRGFLGRSIVRSVLRSEAGQGLGEYGIIIALIAILAILALTVISGSLNSLLSLVGTKI
jgi:pilus assembly protein Flp/PilA